MNDHLHIDLHVEGAGRGATQPVEVEALDDGCYRILYSPGLVELVAAGDIVRLIDPAVGTFEVLERAGNVSVKFAVNNADSISRLVDELAAQLEPLGARLDGQLRNAAVWTIPSSAGLRAIQDVMEEKTATVSGAGWWFGNVHDEEGNVLPWARGLP